MNFPMTGAFCCVVSLLAWALVVAGHDKKDEQASSFSEQAQDFEWVSSHSRMKLPLFYEYSLGIDERRSTMKMPANTSQKKILFSI